MYFNWQQIKLQVKSILPMMVTGKKSLCLYFGPTRFLALVLIMSQSILLKVRGVIEWKYVG